MESHAAQSEEFKKILPRQFARLKTRNKNSTSWREAAEAQRGWRKRAKRERRDREKERGIYPASASTARKLLSYSECVFSRYPEAA